MAIFMAYYSLQLVQYLSDLALQYSSSVRMCTSYSFNFIQSKEVIGNFFPNVGDRLDDIEYPLSILPEHIHSTILFVRQRIWFPSLLRSFPSYLTHPLSLGVSPPHTQTSHSSFWRRTEKTSRCVALLTFVHSLSVYGVKVTGVYYDFSIESSCEVFMHIYSYYNIFYLRFF